MDEFEVVCRIVKLLSNDPIDGYDVKVVSYKADASTPRRAVTFDLKVRLIVSRKA